MENAARLAQLGLLSSVCEALLCYALSKPPKPNPAPGVALSLFKRYQEITDFLKVCTSDFFIFKSFFVNFKIIFL